MSEGQTVGAMSSWKGTGRYDRRLAWDIFGSASSRAGIIHHLCETGLLARVPREGKSAAVRISTVSIPTARIRTRDSDWRNGAACRRLKPSRRSSDTS
jgi:hypothetical protein